MSNNTCEAYGRDLRFFAEFLGRRGTTDPTQIKRDDMLELTRRFTSARSNLARIAGAPFAGGGIPISSIY